MEEPSDATKNCPFCGEKIPTVAIKCRYCREFLDSRKSDLRPAAPPVGSGVRENAGIRHARTVDSELLWQGRPSMAAMIGAIFCGMILLAFAGFIAIAPLNDIDELENITKKIPNFESLRLYVSGGIAAIVLVWLFVRMIFLKTKCYIVTNDRIEYTRGVLSRTTDNLDLFRITDQRMHRSLLDRILGIGTIDVLTTDKTHARFVFYKIRSPRSLYNIIKGASLRADARRGVIHME